MKLHTVVRRRSWATSALYLLLAAALVLALLPLTPQAAAATNPPVVQTFYVPLPENQLLDMFVALRGSGSAALPASPIISNVSIAPVANGTIIYYDHWEDGYEVDLNNPSQPFTEIWGDNNATNGTPPGFATDIINAGNVFILTNDVAVSGGSVTTTTPFQYNGRDKFAVTKTVAVSRVDWASASDTNMVQSTLVYDTNFWGMDYRIPVGTNTATSYTMFEYTAVAVMAGKGGAHVDIDPNGDGSYETTGITLSEGASYWSATNLSQGARVRSTDNPIQVNFLTGDINSGGQYESRDGALLPTSLWSGDYYTPVSTSNSTASWVTRVFLFNPTGSPITINWQSRVGAAAKTTGTISVPANGGNSYTVAPGAAMRFYHSDGTAFYAFSATNAAGTSVTGTNTDNATYDWGYPLVPANALTSQLLVSLGKGGAGASYTSPTTQSNCPVWITPVGNGETPITVYVDRDGNGTSDTTYSLKELQQQVIYDPNDGDQTGMVIWVTDPTVKLAGAWGEHTTNIANGTTSAASPGLDAGTGIPPQPLFDGGKNASLVVDADGDGFISPGDTIEYDIRINNISHVPVPDIVVVDNLPADTTYVPDSTQYRISSGGGGYGSFTPMVDASGPSLPLSGTGFTIATLPVGEQAQIVFRVIIDSYANLTPGATSILNTGTLTGVGITWPIRAETPLYGRISDFVWTDTNGNGIQDAGEPGLAGVTVKLYDSTGTILLATTVTDGNGLYEFTGLLAGSYIAEFVLPSGYSFVQPDQGGDDATDSEADTTTGRTATITLSGGETDNTWDAGLYQPGSISGQVRNDQNADGNLADPDPAISGVTIQLYTDPNGDGDPTDGALVSTTTTDGSGNYAFNNVAPGTYVVVETNLVGYISSGDTIAPNNDRIPVTLPSGGSSAGNDFLDYQLATLGDLVWTDTNGNGIQDAGEPGFAGVTVNVRRATDDTVAGTTTTNASGLWSVSDLPPGDYYVEFMLLSGYSFTQPDQGGDTQDSDPDVATGRTPDVTLESGETNNSLDAGLAPVANVAIGNLVFCDVNGNGIQDASDPGQAGVTVRLYDLGGDGLPYTGDDGLLQSVTTVANGKFVFNAVPAGQYYVAVDTSTLPSSCGTKSSQGGGGNPDQGDQNIAGGDDGIGSQKPGEVVTGVLTASVDGQTTSDIDDPLGYADASAYMTVDFGFTSDPTAITLRELYATPLSTSERLMDLLRNWLQR